MKKQIFLQKVTEQIRSKEAKPLVVSELQHHVNEQKQKLIENGYDETEAEELAVERMGSPMSLGKKLNALYRPKIDWLLLGLFFIVLTLGCLPLLALADVTATTYYVSWEAKVFHSIVAVCAVACILFLRYEGWKRFSLIVYAVGLALLLILNNPELFPFLTGMMNGSPYFHIGFIIVDASMVIPVLLLAWAAFLSNEAMKLWQVLLLGGGTLVPMLYAARLPIFFMYVFMLGVMYVCSKRSSVVASVAAFIGAGSIGAFIADVFLMEYQKERLRAFFRTGTSDPHGVDYMAVQAEKLLQQANWGFHPIPEKGLLLPNLPGDSVYITLAYAFGWGCVIVLTLVLVLILIKLGMVAVQIKDQFGRLLIVGGIAIYSFQLLYNIGMSLGLLPIIGVPLPFISYGLMPVLLHSIVIGIALSVYRRKAFVGITT